MVDYEPSSRSKFLYFAYGSNLFTDRLHLQNPSAVRKTIARLDGYRLDFYKPLQDQSIWNGSSATIHEDEDSHVWGAVWELDLTDMASLDCQEGVHINLYVPLIKEVETLDGERLECRLYQMLNAPTDKIDLSNSKNPLTRMPSKTYMNVILNGAEESKLPKEYIQKLREIVHNGQDAHPSLLEKLNMIPKSE